MTRARDLAAGTFELATGGVLKLETSDTTVTDGSVLGKIEFKAPDEASGTDAILVGAAIEAVAEGTFAADNNATELVFKTGASAAADAKMTLTSGGDLLVGTTNPLPNVNNVEGIALSAGSYGGFLAVSRDNSTPMGINRKTSDGALLDFRKDGTTVGSIGTDTGDLHIHSTVSGHVGLRFGNTRLQPTDNAGAVSNGASDLGFSNSRFKDLYLSGGVYLGGTGAANKLEDYEIGDFAPVYAISGGSVTTGTNAGRYVKVGDFVFFTFRIRTTAVSGTGALSMTLPFASSSENRSGGSRGYARDWGVDMPEFTIYTPPSSSVAIFYRQTMNASTALSVTGSQMGTGGDDNVLEGSIVYKSA